MSDIIERGDAVETKDDGLPGKKWYIPHHGIYHPKKPTITFD